MPNRLIIVACAIGAIGLVGSLAAQPPPVVPPLSAAEGSADRVASEPGANWTALQWLLDWAVESALQWRLSPEEMARRLEPGSKERQYRDELSARELDWLVGQLVRSKSWHALVRCLLAADPSVRYEASRALLEQPAATLVSVQSDLLDRAFEALLRRPDVRTGEDGVAAEYARVNTVRLIQRLLGGDAMIIHGSHARDAEPALRKRWGQQRARSGRP